MSKVSLKEVNVLLQTLIKRDDTDWRKYNACTLQMCKDQFIERSTSGLPSKKCEKSLLDPWIFRYLLHPFVFFSKEVDDLSKDIDKRQDYSPFDLWLVGKSHVFVAQLFQFFTFYGTYTLQSNCLYPSVNNAYSY